MTDMERCRKHQNMNVKKIRKRLSGGFRPLVLRTSHGKEFEVPHPEFIAIGKYDVAVVDKEGDINLLDALHIVSIKSPKSKNGVSGKG